MSLFILFFLNIKLLFFWYWLLIVFLSLHYYTIPVKFEVIDQIDNNGNVTDTYLIIAKDNEEKILPNQILMKLKHLVIKNI